jgi:hypothetical protein
MRYKNSPPTSFLGWLDRLKPKRKFQVWSEKQQTRLKKLALCMHDHNLGFKITLQTISVTKAEKLLIEKGCKI